MGLFDIFKNKNTESENVAPPGKKIVSVDDIYLISVPQEWKEFESDRFRMKTADERVQFSATNYARPEVDERFSIEDLKAQMLPLFDNFVKEGGYERIGSVMIGSNFIYHPF